MPRVSLPLIYLKSQYCGKIENGQEKVFYFRLTLYKQFSVSIYLINGLASLIFLVENDW